MSIILLLFWAALARFTLNKGLSVYFVLESTFKKQYLGLGLAFEF